jgi:2,3-bisphosphoglycerate-independent phosphoglycerate mutase
LKEKTVREILRSLRSLRMTHLFFGFFFSINKLGFTLKSMKFLFLFLDGVGLGADDPEINPLAAAPMPHLEDLLDGHRLVAGVPPLETARATLASLDATLGVEGIPQSATGQATLLTGKNVPKIVGEHYGPKPNPQVAKVIRSGTLFSELVGQGYTAALLNAYPERYFAGIDSGRRLFSAIPLAVTSAGIRLKTIEDLRAGEALAADFTGEGWRTLLGYTDTPVMESYAAGKLLARLATRYDFSFFEYWPSDYAGHRQDKGGAVELLEGFDKVLGGVLEAWDDEAGLALVTSDHGNMEDMSTRRHTLNPVPALAIGSQRLRKQFARSLRSLVDVAPAIVQFYG